MFGKKKTPKHFDLASIGQFSKLEEDQLILLANKAELKTYKSGARLLKLGDKNKNNFFLLEGAVRCKDRNGTEIIIDSEIDKAKKAIAKIRPSLYEVTAIRPSKMILIDATLADTFCRTSTSERVNLSQRINEEQSLNRKIFLKIYEELINDKLKLPSIPSVAFKVREIIETNQTGAQEVCDTINMDPAMAAKVVKAANSPLYKGTSKIETINQAVVRLGLGATQQLVLSFALRDIYKIDSHHLKQLMSTLWEHSIETAAICFLLSSKLNILEPEEALLAGLLHDIGAIPIILYAEQFPSLLESKGAIQEVIDAYKSELGHLILKKWDFADPIITAAKDSEMWVRSRKSVDYCDLVVVAQLHALRGTKKLKGVTALENTPSFSRIGLNKLTSQEFTDLIHEAQHHKDTIKNLLTSS